MELNIFTRKVGEDALNLYPVDMDLFWRIYFRLLLAIGQKINQREEDIMAYILSRPQEEPEELQGRHVPIVKPGKNSDRCLCGKTVDNYRHNDHITPEERDQIYLNASSYVPIDYFTAPHANIMRAELNLQPSEITRLKITLYSKKIIDEQNRPVPALVNLQKYIASKGEATFVFPMKIV